MTFSIDGHEVFVTASIGIAHSATGLPKPARVHAPTPISPCTAPSLPARPDTRSLTAICTRVRWPLQARNRTSTRGPEQRLRPCAYQPIVDLASGRIRGFEDSEVDAPLDHLAEQLHRHRREIPSSHRSPRLVGPRGELPGKPDGGRSGSRASRPLYQRQRLGQAVHEAGHRGSVDGHSRVKNQVSQEPAPRGHRECRP